jgi:uncharacterized protein (UPF0332 family)
MGNGLSPAVQKLLEERKILRVRRDSALIAKEIAAAKADLKKSKWATIQGYYAMFHSARALLYEKGFREKSHHALLVAVRELYVSEIERSLIQEFEHGMYLRQEADYGLKFSGRGAQDVIDIAEKMLERTKSILKLK